MVGSDFRTGSNVKLNDEDPLERSGSVRLDQQESAEPEGNEEVARRHRVILVGYYVWLNAPTFAGIEGPRAAEDFLRKIEKILRLLGCMSWEKILLATYSL